MTTLYPARPRNTGAVKQAIAEGCQTVKEISEASGISVTHVQTLVNELLQAGEIERIKHVGPNPHGRLPGRYALKGRVPVPRKVVPKVEARTSVAFRDDPILAALFCGGTV